MLKYRITTCNAYIGLIYKTSIIRPPLGLEKKLSYYQGGLNFEVVIGAKLSKGTIK
jgi:hypothetical protein